MREKSIEIEIPPDVIKNWQEIVNVAAKLVDVPAALIMRHTDPEIEVLLSSQSDGNPYQVGDHETFHDSGLYCETVINSQSMLLVEDALSDDDWKENPDVKLNMISYLGFPLNLPDQRPFGTICVLDNKPNAYSATYQALINQFRDLIESQIAMLYMNQTLGDENQRLQDVLDELQTLRGLIPICANCKSIRDKQNHWHPIDEYLHKKLDAEFSHGVCPKCCKVLYPDYAEE